MCSENLCCPRVVGGLTKVAQKQPAPGGNPEADLTYRKEVLMLRIHTRMSFDLVIQARLRRIAAVVYWLIR